MKKLLIGLLILLLALSIVGCGVKEKLEEKAGEALAEKILGDAGVDVDLNSDKVVIKGEDGETFTVGGTDWPASNIAKAIPEFTKGEITSVMEAESGVMVMVESVTEVDYEDYLEKIKQDFTEDAFEFNSQDSRAYGGSNGDGVSVQVMFGSDSVSITVSKTAE